MRFGTDGIRGRWPLEPLTPAVVAALGSAIVEVLGPQVAVVRDTRPSGPAVLDALGRDPALVLRSYGVLPTAAASVLVAGSECDAGVIVTASHNPAHDNGVKVIGPDGHKLDRDTERRLDAALARHLASPRTQARERLSDRPGGAQTYQDALLACLPAGRWLAGRAVAVDCAHGAAVATAPALLEALGARVVRVGCDPAGAINDGVGALHPDLVARAVVDQACDAGIALDGDADRCVLVTGSGRVVDGDALLLLLAQGPGVVGTILCNEALAQALAARDMALVRTGVGDRQVAQELARLGWYLGGEPSGHVLFRDGLPTGDGMLTGLRTLAGGLDLDARLADWRPHAQATATVPVADRPALETLPLLQAALAGLSGRAVVRYSGTEPKLRLQVEAPRSDEAERELQLLLDAVRASGVGVSAF